MIIELKNIYKTYTQGTVQVPALIDISMDVQERDYFAIMGPSGSGKSTLMNIIGCLDEPSSGVYNFEGESVLALHDSRLSEIRNRYIGFVFQSFNLMPRQTAVENVELPLLYSKSISRTRRREIASEALFRVGLEDRMDFKPTQLSGGQKQRVAIARAIVNNPRIILADEPTGALDSKSGEQVMEIFEKLNSEGATILVITHERDIANRAKHMMVIRDGEFEQVPGGTSA
ncbi:MAG: ABC transporter ATP-binding protein [Oscillospiraceae bacterium]|nr:ABC transporter ATP-binding protein [Oscillospiraceae bacterium]